MSPQHVPPSGDQRNLGTAIALGGLLLVGGGIFALVMVVLPIARGFCWLSLIIIVPALLHYFVWGRWMSQMRERALAEERRKLADSNSGTPFDA